MGRRSGVKLSGPQKNFFIRGDFYPRLDVDKDANIVRSIDQGSMMQIYDAAAGPNGTVKEVSFGVGPDQQYKCQPLALEGIINHYEREQADDVLQYDKRQTGIPRLLLEFALEKKSVDSLRTAANYGPNAKTLGPNELFD